MDRTARRRLAPWALAGFGLVLSGTAAVWHSGIEIQRLGQARGPLVALFLVGTLPLALVYGSYRLLSAAVPRERIWSVFVWTLAGGVTFGAVIVLSIFIRAAEGRTVAEPVFITLLAVDTGAVAGFVAGYYATKARRDADRAARTTHTLSFVNDFLRHDIKNGLTVIDGRVAILQTEAESDEAMQAATAIREQVTELSRLIDSAGAVAETLSADPDFETVDMVSVTEDVVEGLRTTHDASIVVDVPDRAVVYANDAVRSVLRNLIENAIEHGTPAEAAGSAVSEVPAATIESATGDCPRSQHEEPSTAAGERPPMVVVRIELTPDVVEIHVVDDGPGIPDERTTDVFAPRAGETHGGGLHLVETLVGSFGGDIRVVDANGRPERAAPDADLCGAHFVVELPRAE